MQGRGWSHVRNAVTTDVEMFMFFYQIKYYFILKWRLNFRSVTFIFCWICILHCQGIHIIVLLYNKCHWTVCRKSVLVSHNSSICFHIPGILNDLCDCPSQRVGSNIFEIQQYSHSRWGCSKHIKFLVSIYWDPHYRNAEVDGFMCTEKSTVRNE